MHRINNSVTLYATATLHLQDLSRCHLTACHALIDYMMLHVMPSLPKLMHHTAGVIFALQCAITSALQSHERHKQASFCDANMG